MSGAEVIAVLGVISSVIAIVDGTKKVHILELTKTDIEDGDGDENVRKEVKDLVNTCGEKAKRLNGIFRKVIPSENASRTKRYYSAVTTLGKGNQVELLMKGMLEDVQLLTSNWTMNAMTNAQAEQVVKAISKLSALQSSVPENIFEETAFTANNSGSGTQTNYHAQGEYIAQGNAKQYNSAGGAMHFAETTNNIYNQNPHNLKSDNQSQTDCLAALFLTDSQDDRASMIYAKGQRARGICEWIRTNHIYLSWLSSDSQLLWISGGPGKGKTMLSMFLAEEFEKMAEVPKYIFLQYFCDAKRNNAVTILRGLLYQLLKAVPSLFDHILPEFKSQQKIMLTSFETLWRVFATMICDPVLGGIYCVLDGIDECDEASADLLLKKFRELFLKNNGDISNVHLKIVLLSRDLPDFIPESLSTFPRIQLDFDSDREVNNDIDRFIEIKVDQLSILKNYGSSLTVYVKNEFRKKAQSTFLWVGLMAQELEKYRASEVENILQLFPSGLEALYARMLLQIMPHQRQAAIRILRWVVLAIKPLTLIELTLALGGTTKTSDFLSPIEIVRDQVLSCGCLLSINDDVVGLVHQSAKDYLLRTASDPNPELELFRVNEYSGNLEIARECLKYLQDDQRKVLLPANQRSTRLFKNPFLEYAVRNWFLHARSLSCREDIFDLSLPFYKSHLWQFWVEVYRELSMLRFKFWLEPQTLLQCSSAFGILPLVQNLLSWKYWVKHPFLINERNADGFTALDIAAFNGHVAIAQCLLANGAAVNAKNGIEQTPLHSAARGGHEVMIRFLIDSGADMNAKDKCGRLPLFLAVKYDHIIVVQLLLELGTDLGTKLFDGRTALIEACMERSEPYRMVEFLLKKGMDIEAKQENGGTALTEAAMARNWRTVELLLDNRANIDARKNDGSTALIEAAKGDSLGIVKVLLERRANFNARNNDGSTALIEAAKGDSLGVVMVLLEKGANLNARNNDGSTALIEAANVKNWRMAEALLERGVNVDPREIYGYMAGIAAARARNTDFVDMLLKTGTNFEA